MIHMYRSSSLVKTTIYKLIPGIAHFLQSRGKENMTTKKQDLQKGNPIYFVAGSLFKNGVRRGWIHEYKHNMKRYVPVIVVETDGEERATRVLKTSFMYGEKKEPSPKNDAEYIYYEHEMLEQKMYDLCTALASAGITKGKEKDAVSIFQMVLNDAIVHIHGREPSGNKEEEKAPEKKNEFRMKGNGGYTIGGKTNAKQKRAKTRPNEGDENDSIFTDERGRLHS
jgi:hypothetical protein